MWLHAEEIKQRPLGNAVTLVQWQAVGSGTASGVVGMSQKSIGIYHGHLLDHVKANPKCNFIGKDFSVYC